MADLKLPRYIGACPRCGEPLEVVKQRSTPMPGEIVIDFTVRCTAWCGLAESGDLA